MKSILKPIALIAAVSCVFACNKFETETEEIQQVEEFTYTFGFANGDAATLGTKATFASDETGMYIDFEDGDDINAYAYSTTEEKYSYNKQGAINYAADPVTFQVTSHYALVKDDEIYCHFPYSNSGQSPDNINLSIKSAQTQKGEKYDAKAAPMVSAPFAVQESFTAKTEKTVGDIKFYNLASVIELDIFSPTGAYASENINSITFTSSDAVAGSFTFDLTKVSTNDESTLAIEGYTAKTVELTFSESLNVGTATKKDNAKKAYLVVAPGTHAGTLTVVTDNAKYTYEVPSREFKRAHVRQFGINLEKEGARKASSNVEFTLVESASNIQDGATYLIVSYTASKYWAMSSFNGGNYYVSYEVSPSSKKFTVSDDQVVSVTLEDAGGGAYYLKDSDGLYIKGVSSNNLEREATADGDAFKWNVAVDKITNVSLTTRQIMLNAATTPKRFAGYTGTQTAINLYVDATTLKQTLETPTVIASVEGSSVTAEWIEDENAGSYIVTLSNNETDTVTGTTKTFTGLSDGTYTVSVVAVAKDAKKYYNSEAGVSNAVVVGTPTLASPTITEFKQTATGFSAKWTAGDEYATSYSWELYEGPVENDELVGMGSTNSTSISVAFSSDDMDIDSFTAGTKYYFVIKATASGYADSDTVSDSFDATNEITKGATWTHSLANGDLSDTGATKSWTSGSKSMSWTHSFTWESSTHYLTFVGGKTNHYQIGASSSRSMTSMTLTSSDYTDGIESVTVTGSVASGNTVNVTIKLNDETVATGSITTTTNGTANKFSFDSVKAGGKLEIILTQSTSSKAFYLKEIRIN